VKLEDGGTLRTWVVYPERKEKTGVVLVIQEKLGKDVRDRDLRGGGPRFPASADRREGANLRAREEAWPRVLTFLRQHLGS
jgi:dienelactone hydrolase